MKFRKKPVVIEAMQWDTNRLIHDHPYRDEIMRWLGPAAPVRFEDERMLIVTLEGEMYCEPMDWVIRGIKGELYPCKPDIFAATYEPA